MDKRTSIKDIAAKLGVSIALVSYVLNGKEKEARVGSEIAAKIRHTAKLMNYKPNQIARTLQSGKSFTIGLIVADISNPFFAAIARVIEDEAKRYNYTVLFGSCDEKEDRFNDLFNILSNRQVDGFIIAAAEHTEKQLQKLLKQQTPFVLIDRYFKGINAHSVRIDNHQAAFDAVTHLAQKGYTRIAMAAYDTTLQHMEDRKKGWLDALKKNGLKTDPALLGKIGFDTVEKDMESFIPSIRVPGNMANAIFFATNMLAINGLKQIIRLGIRVPEDLGIITFDANPAFDFFHTPLSFIKQPPEEIGKAAVSLLLEHIDNPGQQKKTIVIKAPLITRASTPEHPDGSEY